MCFHIETETALRNRPKLSNYYYITETTKFFNLCLKNPTTKMNARNHVFARRRFMSTKRRFIHQDVRFMTAYGTVHNFIDCRLLVETAVENVSLNQFGRFGFFHLLREGGHLI